LAILLHRSVAADLGAAAGRRVPMLDVIMVVLGLGFFVLALGFAAACDGM